MSYHGYSKCVAQEILGGDLAHSRADGVLAGARLHHLYRYDQTLCLDII